MAPKYDAFISYRHAPLDSKVASEIQKKLERARTPWAIQKKTGKKKIERIFRDKEELPITSDINDDISEALENSEYLIVICSTNTAQSIWVQREIEAFLRLHDRNHVLTVLADGEPQDVIPEILRYKEVETTDEDGAVVKTTVDVEPLSCDYRNTSAKARREELPRLLAVLLGCSYDDLRQRQRRRMLQQLTAVFLAALVLVSGIAVYALDRAHRIAQQAEIISQQAEQIEREYENTLITQSRYLSQISGQLLSAGDREGAIKVAMEALPDGEEDDSRPLVTEALYALNNSLYTYSQASYRKFLPEKKLDCHGDYYVSDSVSPEGTRWLVQAYDSITVYDIEEKTCLMELTTEELLEYDEYGTISDALLISEDRLMVATSTGHMCWDVNEEKLLWRLDGTNGLANAYNAKTGELYVYRNDIFEGGDILQCLDSEDGSILKEIPLGGYRQTIGFLRAKAILSEDGRYLGIGNLYRDEADVVLVVDLETGTALELETQFRHIGDISFACQGRVVVQSYDGEELSGLAKCGYAVETFDLETGQRLWAYEDKMSLIRSWSDSSELRGQIMLAEVQREYGSDLEELLLTVLGRKLLFLDPESGKVEADIEFASETLTMDLYEPERLFLSFRDGSILQFMFGTWATDEMGRITAGAAAAVYNKELGTYGMLLEDCSSVIVMNSRIEDEAGVCRDDGNTISMNGYAGDGTNEYRAVREYRSLGEAGYEYWISFYKVHESQPSAVTETYEQADSTVAFTETDGQTVAYWLAKENEELYLMGWNIDRDERYCKQALGVDTEWSCNLIGVADRTAVIRRYDGVILLDAQTGQTKQITSEEYLYDVAMDAEHSAVIMLEDVFDDQIMETRLRLRRVSYPDMEECVTPPETDTLLAAMDSHNMDMVLSPNGERLLIPAGNQFLLLDSATLEIVQEIPLACKQNQGMDFYSEDILLLMGDSGCLTSWSISEKRVLMEDQYVQIAGAVYSGKGICYTYDYQEDFYPTVHLYRVAEDGTFCREFSVRNGTVSSDGTEVTTQLSTEVVVFQTYTLDELLQKARAIVGDQGLTEMERIKYFVEG